MTLIDEAPGQTGTQRARRPRVVWVFGALAVLFLLIGLGGGSFQGKLADVQKNDNSSFLPGSADSTKVANEQQKFASVQSIPGFMVYERKGGLTAADRQHIAENLTAFKSAKGVSVDEIQQVKPVDGSADVAAISVPLIAKHDGKSVKGPDLVKAEKALIKKAKAGAPAGLVIHSAGAGGVIVAFIDAFNGLDGQLLVAAGIVVVVILLFVYRSPILWAFPLVCAVLAQKWGREPRS